jgi:Cu+-exporting ATPase
VAASVTQKDLQSEIIISSYLLSNLHCPTCVSHIQETLSALHPKPVSISPSLVSSWVTVKHDSKLSENNIQEALEDAGFDVCNVTSEAALGPLRTGYHGEIGYLDRFFDEWDSDKAREFARSRDSTTHVRNCESCRLADIKHYSSRKNDSSQDPSSSKLSPIKQGKAMWVPTDSKSEFPLVIIDSVASEDLWRATLAVGGMTCVGLVFVLHYYHQLLFL